MNENDAFDKWIKEFITADKKEFVFSPDVLRMMLRLAWVEGAKNAREIAAQLAKDAEHERRYGYDQY